VPIEAKRRYRTSTQFFNPAEYLALQARVAQLSRGPEQITTDGVTKQKSLRRKI
jgi:hypothetical protein